MTSTRTALATLALALGAGVSTTACAQSGAQGSGQGSALDRRVAAVGTGMAQLHFDSREDACGDGARWFRFGDDSWYGNFSGSVNAGDDAVRTGCASGPVRVLLSVADREIVKVETYVGPLQRAEGTTDLGLIPSRDASAWLLGIAARSDGRPARDAILPAVLAKDGTPGAALLAIARDKDRARDTRRSAISYLVRAAEANTEQSARALAQLARDDTDTPTVRQQAVSTLLRLPGGAGIAALSQLAVAADDPWLGREATRALARSGDPRAREFLRNAVANTRLADDLRAAAISGLGGDQATGQDAKLLRDTYRALTVDKTKDAVLGAVSAVGGKVNADWLLGVARDDRESSALRRKAVSLAERAGAGGAELSGLYDAMHDTEMRNAVISALAQEGSKSSRDKLVAIARSSEAPAVRRRAISALERFDSPEVREALAALAAPRP